MTGSSGKIIMIWCCLRWQRRSARQGSNKGFKVGRTLDLAKIDVLL